MNRKHHLYFLFQVCAGLLFVTFACNHKNDSSREGLPPLFPAPKEVPLNLREGYVINQLRGDSVWEIINFSGDTISGKTARRALATKTQPEPAVQPSLIEVSWGKAEVIPSNVHSHFEHQVETEVNEHDLRQIVIDDAYLAQKISTIVGDSVGIGTPFENTEKAIPFHFPKPAAAWPPRFTDDGQYDIQYLDVEQGLISSNVFCIDIDPEGMLWFGTNNGASRYDGKSFYHFNESQGHQLFQVFNMTTDAQHHRYFATDAGLVRYDGKSFRNLSQDIRNANSNLYSVMVDRHGRIWAGTYGGTVVVYEPEKDGKAGTFTNLLVKAEIPNGLVTCILEDSRGHIWFALSRGGVCRYEPSTNGWKGTFTYFTEEDGLCSNNIWSICEDKWGQLWFGGGMGVTRYTPPHENQHAKLTRFTVEEGLSQGNVRVVYADRNNNIWIGTNGGGVNLLQWHEDAMHHHPTITHITEAEGLSNNLVYAFYEDDHGNMWIATKGGGVNCFNPSSFRYNTELNGLSNKVVRGLYEDRSQRLWIGTEGPGLSFYKDSAYDIPSHFKTLTTQNGYVLRWINCIYEDSFGVLWIAPEAGVVRMDTKQPGDHKIFTHYTAVTGFSDAWITDIIEDDAANLWFGTYGDGLLKYVRGRDNQGGYFEQYQEKDGLPCNLVSDLMITRDGTLWVASEIGGVSYLPNAASMDTTARFWTTLTERQGLSNNRVITMTEDPEGRLWFGTDGGGINLYTPSSGNSPGRFTYLTMAEGLTINNVSSILATPDGRGGSAIWAGTIKGLNLIRRNEGENAPWQIIPLERRDGVKTNIFTPHSVHQNKDHRLWWGTTRGILTFDAHSFTPSAKIPEPILTGLDINGKFTDYSHLADSLTGKIQFDSFAPFENYPLRLSLGHRQNHLTFHLSAIDWAAPQKIRYSYKMEGLDESWSLPTEETQIDYRNLPSGTHTFKVRAIGESRTWSEPFTYSFTIRPPWWYSWWAILMYACSGGFILYRTHRYQLNRKLVNAEQQRRQELDRVKNRLYTNITHEFRTPLTLIHGPVSQALSKNVPLDQQEIRSIYRQSERLQQLINQMLELQKLESGMLKPHYQYGEIIQTLRYLFGSFETWAREKNISMLFSSSLQEVYMDIDTEKLTQIISNLVSNAIKHTPRNGKIAMAVSISDSGDLLQIQVADTGHGIPESDLPHIFERYYQSSKAASGGTGIGLALVKSLTELLGGAISVDSKPEVGTTFKLTLPVSRSAQAMEVPSGRNRSEEAEMIAAEPGFSEPEQPNPLRPILLVVEDHPEVAQYIVSCLSAEYTVLTAADGKEGLRQAHQNVPDLIVSDVMMPGMDGFEFCQHLKTDIHTSHIPVILLTGRGDHEALMTGIELGAEAYVVKPFDPDELRLRVRKLLELRANLNLHYRQFAFTKAPEKNIRASARENEFLKKLSGYIEEHLQDAQFNMEKLCHYMAMSHPQLHRKITALTGESTGKFVRSIRLARAKELLANTELTISEVAYETGFSEPGYFTKVFSKEFDMTPSDFRAGL